jgi:hypothetical protein
MSLQTFIIQEDLRGELASRFLLYQERYNTQVLLDLKKSLEKDWTKEINSLSKKHKIDDEDAQLAQFENPKATTALSVESKDEKVTSSRNREPTEVSPSVKIPLLYKAEERDLIMKSILDEAERTFKDITHQWREIFQVEKKGRATPWFKIVRDKDEIRFQLALSSDQQEMYRTLYSIRTEYGKKGSKTKDFDRIYLISLI